MPATGGPQRLVASDTVDWFPHLSPDGPHATYISFPTGTLGHPADLPSSSTSCAPRLDQTIALIPLFGGQGSLNVNSWSPDGRRFAYVAYPSATATDDHCTPSATGSAAARTDRERVRLCPIAVRPGEGPIGRPATIFSPC